MTTPSSALPQGARDNMDTGPLSWVIGEIRETLNRSRAALHEAVTQDADAQSTGMRLAKSHLHQAHGALQIVDVDGVAIITETVEDLLDRVDAGQLPLTSDLVQAIDHGYQALVEYLEELLAGTPHQPVRLFPYYRALLEARGAERIHPADLFFPNLSIRPQLPPIPPIAAGAADYARLRQRFEMALLPFLKSSDQETEMSKAAVMRDIIADVEKTQSNPQARSFWWVMHGLAEAVAAGQVSNEIYVKQLFARINLQIRRLAQGSSSIAERLLRDALFFIAKAKNPSPRAQQIRHAYRLDGLVPLDYDRKRYGQIDVNALAVAKERLGQAKNLWNRIAGGDPSVAESFEHEMRVLADSVSKLNSAPLSKLLRELKGIARHAAHARPGDMLGLEMATSLLFVENSLNQIGRLPENFAERADAMTARLLAVVSGEGTLPSAQWLDDMSREAQQRQTMGALAGEMQTSLRQVEKLLDEYFRDPAQPQSLSQLDQVLHQIEGALAVLDQEDAVRTIQHTRQAVQRFIDAEEGDAPDQQQFQKVAQNVGALSFFIETLQHGSGGVQKRFSFDEEQGLFQAKLLESTSDDADLAPPVEDDSERTVSPVNGSDPAAFSLRTVEDELAQHQRQSADLAMSLSAEPGNQALQEQLKESLEQIRLDAALIDNREVTDRAKMGLNLLEQPDFPASQQALAEIMNAATPTKASAEPLPPVSAPSTDEAVDAELLEIFLSEAEEVLGTVRQTLPESRQEPHNQDHLTTLRRSFHTLKGSGRMVGLTAFGEAAWSIEQVLNLCLGEARGGDEDLYALLEKATELLEAWVQDLSTNGRSERTPDGLIASAARVKAGAAFSYDDSEAGAAPQSASEVESAVPEKTGAAGSPDIQGLEFPSLAGSAGGASLTAEQESDHGLMPADGIAGDAFELSPDSEPALPQVEEIEPSAADLAIFALGVQPASTDNVSPAPTVPDGLSPMSVPAQVIDFPTMPMAEFKLNDNVKRIGDLEISLPLHNIYLAETDELVRLLAHDIAEWRHEPERDVHIHAVHAAHSLSGSSATVGFSALHELAHALEMVLQCLARKPVRLLQHEFDTLEQSIERLKLMLQKFALGEMPAYEAEFARLLSSLRQDLERRAENSHTGSSGFEHSVASANSQPDTRIEGVAGGDHAVIDDESASYESLPEEFQAIDETASASVEAAPTAAAPNESVVTIGDDLDADLLPVFLEEGRDMFPQMSAALRAWHAKPSDMVPSQSLLRLLHTLKGSARMAGAMALGQHLHDMETRIENLAHIGSPAAVAIEDLLVRYDQALYMFDQLQNPDAPRQTAPLAQEPSRIAGEATGEPASARQVVELPAPLVSQAAVSPDVRSPVPHQTNTAIAPTTAAPLVRVRADILDRLVNQAGEVSISRSKLETEVGTLRQSLSELTENVVRLRDQLREIEMQAESQIASNMAQSADREFDPLEFDRFTRLQELTRMMAESVNDVGSVHQNLTRTLDSAVTDLSIQARLTRDLQQDLMRVRMVQFASISERLFRVTRQAAKEVDKRVNLDIRGSGVEIDRGVLERMTGPFEHLLRNAIAHGIESREARRAAGKSEIGELLVEVRQEGNEVVIQFSDDGQGLNLERIRDKARRVGLLTNDTAMSDEEVSDLIFHPGFSTAEQITELAGRGIGMDVVRSEAAALGGRVSTWSEPGKGAHFTIRLPLTLAVTQVVLLSTGGKTYAVPSVLVEQVQQLKTHALTSAYNDGAVVWMGQRVPLWYLSTLLGDVSVSPVAQQYSPLLILKSGNERVALHVDEIVGNREVVVKNIGPQLARMIGVAGATVLGSGDIVLILNPVPLAQRAAQESVRAPRLIPSDAPDAMGAVAEMPSREPKALQAEPVQGLRTQNIVMVVDDSLTVRRVTQRLLSREGYQVVVAKDGVDALEQLQSVTPDVMLVDIEMPRMDGFDLTRNVRGDERTRHIPIIMITSRTAAKHRNYALELGVNEYLGKPYQEEQLLSLIANFVGREAPIA